MYVVGKLLGISDDLNLCSGGSLTETRSYAYEIHQRIILPNLSENCSDALCCTMAGHMLKGAAMINPLIIPEAFETWTFRLIFFDTLWQTVLYALPSLQGNEE